MEAYGREEAYHQLLQCIGYRKSYLKEWKVVHRIPLTISESQLRFIRSWRKIREIMERRYRNFFGSPIPITSCIADQHAALFAQGCRENGMAKLTNGTGSFIDLNIGENSVVMDGADTVVAWKINGKICYAIEGYAAVTGSAVQWVRDGLKFIKSSGEIEALAESVPDTNGVYFVPALAGLGCTVLGSICQRNDHRTHKGCYKCSYFKSSAAVHCIFYQRYHRCHL